MRNQTEMMMYFVFIELNNADVNSSTFSTLILICIRLAPFWNILETVKAELDSANNTQQLCLPKLWAETNILGNKY